MYAFRVSCHSSDPHPESGGAKFVLEKLILGWAGWWSKTGWDFAYLGGAQICGWGFSNFGYKNIFAGAIFFSLTSFQILKKKHPIFNFPYFSKFQFFSVFQFSWGIFQLSFQFSIWYCLINHFGLCQLTCLICLYAQQEQKIWSPNIFKI